MRLKLYILFFILFLIFSANNVFAYRFNQPEISGNSIWFFILSAVLILGAFILWKYFKKNKSEINFHYKKIIQDIQNIKNQIEELELHSDEWKKERIQYIRQDISSISLNIKALEQSLTISKKNSRKNSLLLSNISHALRTNLNDILGFSSLLRDEFALKEEEELYEYSENIWKSGESLMHLLNNIIDISRIEAKTFSLKKQNCNLNKLLDELINEFNSKADQKGLKIVKQTDKIPEFSIDVQALKHILSNIIDNAVKYTDKGFIKIKADVENENIVVVIKDTGMGIDKAYLNDIFEPFRQHSLGYSKTTYQGAGLGLPLAKQMIELMDGNIDLHSEKAVGTTVTITLPLTKTVSTKKDIEKSPQKVKKIKKYQLKTPIKKLVIIDTDFLNNMLIRKMLPDSVQIFFFKSIDELKESVRKKEILINDIELFILNIDIEKNDNGKELLKEINKIIDKEKNVRIIAMVSTHIPGLEKKMIKDGFMGYIEKPLTKQILFQSIEEALAENRSI